MLTPPSRLAPTTADNSSPFVIGARENFTVGYAGLLDDFALWSEALTEGKATALHSLAVEPGLQYGISEIQQLFDVYNAAGASQATIGGLSWQYVTGLNTSHPGLTLGQVEKIGDFYFLQLDASGLGVAAVPEPAAVWLLGSGGLALGLVLRRSRRRKAGF
jgi:hypothetical protein